MRGNSLRERPYCVLRVRKDAATAGGDRVLGKSGRRFGERPLGREGLHPALAGARASFSRSTEVGSISVIAILPAFRCLSATLPRIMG